MRWSVARGGGVWLGRESVIGDGARVVVGPGAAFVVGAGCVVAEGCRVVSRARVELSEGCRLGPGVTIVDFAPALDDVETPVRLQDVETAPVLIGERARIGRGAAVLRGVTVGAAAGVGPHAVVEADVPPGATVAGVPAYQADER